MRLGIGIGMQLGRTILGGAAGSTLSNGLIHAWPMTTVNGGTADVIGSWNLSDPNDNVQQVAGKRGNAAGFGAVSSMPKTLVAVPASYTIAFWFKTESTYENAPVGFAVFGSAAGGRQTSPGSFSMSAEDASNSGSSCVVAAVGYTAPGVGSIVAFYEVLAGVNQLNNGAWHLYIASYDAATKKVSVSADNSPPAESPALGTRVTSTGITLGRELPTVVSQEDMAMDEVLLWDRVLTSDERTELYNAGAGKFYPF